MWSSVMLRGLIVVVTGIVVVCGSPYFIQGVHKAALASSDKGGHGGADFSLMDVFKRRYDQVMRAVNEGKIHKNKGAEAERLWISLQKQVIDSNAKIDTYKLDIRHSNGQKQEEALEGLVTAAAERERVMMDSLYRLEKLSGLSFDDIPLGSDRREDHLSAKGTRDSANKGSRRKVIEIESEAEDLIKDKQFLE